MQASNRGSTGSLRRIFLKTNIVVRSVSDLGFQTTCAVVTNSLRMSFEKRRTGRTGRTGRTKGSNGARPVTRTPGKIVSVERVGLGDFRIAFVEDELMVSFSVDGVLRLTWGRREETPLCGLSAGFSPDHNGRSGRNGAPVVAEADNNGVRVRTSQLTLEVDQFGAVKILDASGYVVHEEMPPLRRGGSRVWRWRLRDGEVVAGLGEQAGRVDLRGSAFRLWNRDPGGAWSAGQDPLYCSIPVVVGMHTAGNVLVFHNNSHEAVANLSDRGTGATCGSLAEISFARGPLDYFVVVGTLPQVMERYGELTGRHELPPRWALGYHQSRWGYRSESEIKEVARRFAEEGLPLSAVHLDIDYMDHYRVFTLNRDRFPDLEGLSESLAARETQLVAIVDPAVKIDGDYDVFTEGERGAHFVTTPAGETQVGVVWPGRAAFPDFTDPRTRKWWSQLYLRLTDLGIAGVWHDMNEPTSISLWGDRTLPLSARHSIEGRGGDHLEAHNTYGLLMDEAGCEGLKRARPDRRPFVVSRSGWAGVQRSAWTWTGDVDSSEEGLHQQVATAVGLGLSGVAFSGSDIGGFSGAPGPELYLRWLEMALFMPFCRTHSVIGSPRREPWCFPEPYRSAIGRLIRFRYRLLPYLYTLAFEASKTGHPLVRPLSWPRGEMETRGVRNDDASHGGDSVYEDLDDAFFLGDSLLIAPITKVGERSKAVSVPPGYWYRWRFTEPITDPITEDDALRGSTIEDDFEVIAGARREVFDAQCGQPVVLVAAGTVLPLDDSWSKRPRGCDVFGERGSSSTPGVGHAPRKLSLHLFPEPFSGDGDGGVDESAGREERLAYGEVYDDAGDGFGEHREDRFTLVRTGGDDVADSDESDESDDSDGRVTSLKLEWEKTGNYPPPREVVVVLHGVVADDVILDGVAVRAIVERGGGLGSSAVVGGSSFTAVECGPFSSVEYKVVRR